MTAFMNHTNNILVRRALDRAIDEMADLPMPEWPDRLQYTLMALEHKAEGERIEATADEIREFLEAVRAMLDDRLETGKWQAM